MVRTYEHDGTSVHMSPEAADHYGEWAQEFPEWASSQGIEEVVILTPEGVLNGRNLEDLGPGEAQGLVDAYMAENHPELTERYFSQDSLYMNDIRDMAVTGAARAMAMDVDGDGVNEVGLIVTPNMDATALDLTIDKAGYRDLETSGTVATDLERQVAVIAHEIGHMDHADKGNPMTSFEAERNAEGDMVAFLESSRDKGLIDDPAVIAEHTQSRSIGVFFHQQSNSHDVGPSVLLPTEAEPALEASDNEYHIALGDAKSKVYMDAAETAGLREGLTANAIYNQDIPSFSDLTESDRGVLRDFFQGNVSQEDTMGALSPETAEVLNDRLVLEAIKSGEIDPQVGLQQLSEDMQSQIGANVDIDMFQEGHRLVTEDPQLMYQTVQGLNEQGAFSGNPIEQQYVDEFLAAAEALAPAQFGVTIEEGSLNLTRPTHDFASATGMNLPSADLGLATADGAELPGFSSHLATISGDAAVLDGVIGSEIQVRPEIAEIVQAAAIAEADISSVTAPAIQTSEPANTMVI